MPRLDWTDLPAVIAHAREYGPGNIVIRRKGFTTFSITKDRAPADSYWLAISAGVSARAMLDRANGYEGAEILYAVPAR